MDAAKDQMKVHEQDVVLALGERERLQEIDLLEANRVESSSAADDSKEEEEEEVDNTDPNKTKWVSETWQRRNI